MRHIVFDLTDEEWQQWIKWFKSLPDWDMGSPISPRKIGNYLKRKVNQGDLIFRDLLNPKIWEGRGKP